MVWACGDNGRQEITSKLKLFIVTWMEESRGTKAWMDNVRQDAAGKDMDLRTDLGTIRDRERWRQELLIPS